MECSLDQLYLNVKPQTLSHELLVSGRGYSNVGQHYLLDKLLSTELVLRKAMGLSSG